MGEFFQAPRGTIRKRFAEAQRRVETTRQEEALNQGIKQFSKTVEEVQRLPKPALPPDGTAKLPDNAANPFALGQQVVVTVNRSGVSDTLTVIATGV